MNALKTILSSSIVACAIAASTPTTASETGRVIVKPANAKVLRAISESRLMGFIEVPATVHAIGDTGAFVVESDDAGTEALLTGFRRWPEAFTYVQPDATFTSHAVVMPEDPEFLHSPSQLWGLYAVSAPKAWMRGQGSGSVVVAVMDSGIDQFHEDLVDNLWRVKKGFRLQVGQTVIDCRPGDFGFDAIDGDCQPQDREEHGTNLSGIIGARGDNEIGTVGVNWRVSILPVSFLDRSRGGSVSRAALALEFIRKLKERNLADIRVLNLSWGAHHHSRLIEDELMRLAALGVVIVTSAGNEARDNDACPMYPAGYDSVSTLISVAATRRDGNIAQSSNRGRRSIHIAAPGIGIRTTDPGNSYDSPFGTSMAAAIVTGAVALLASQCPTLTGVQLKELILRTADRRGALEPHVIEGRFLNVQAASERCATVPLQSRTLQVRTDGLH